MPRACVLSVYNLPESLWANRLAIHSTLPTVHMCVEKEGSFTQLYTQCGQKLYTGFRQVFSTITSVGLLAVHIFHSAYKKNHKVRKG